jgi:hypothetical protein
MFDYVDYPAFFSSEAAARQKAASAGSMQKVMEVYHLKSDKEPQIKKRRCWAFQDSI